MLFLGIFFANVSIICLLCHWALNSRSVLDEIKKADLEGRPPDAEVMNKTIRGIKTSPRWLWLSAVTGLLAVFLIAQSLH